MSMSIGSSSKYDQILNNTKNELFNTSINNNNATSKTTSKDEYFSDLCNKYPNVNLNIGNSVITKDNQISVTISPKLINKAVNDPKAAENLTRILDQMGSVKDFVNAKAQLMCGGEAKSISFIMDEDGGLRCKVELKHKGSKNTKNDSHKNKLDEDKLKELRDEKSNEEKAEEVRNRKLHEEKVRRIKEQRAKMSREQKMYDKMAKNMDINLFDTNI